MMCCPSFTIRMPTFIPAVNTSSSSMAYTRVQRKPKKKAFSIFFILAVSLYSSRNLTKYWSSPTKREPFRSFLASIFKKNKHEMFCSSFHQFASSQNVFSSSLWPWLICLSQDHRGLYSCGKSGRKFTSDFLGLFMSICLFEPVDHWLHWLWARSIQPLAASVGIFPF